MNTLATPAEPVMYGQSQHKLAPRTPSPLRTSHNTNLMPPPQWPSSSPLDLKSSPLAPYPSAPRALLVTPTQPRRASTPSIFFSLSSPGGPDACARSSFASRSQASTPHATLSAQNAAARDRRKYLFRDKIRKQRDDARFGGRTDQMLRIDFVRERRAWEERLARSAPVDLDGDDGMESTDDITRGEKEEEEEDGVVPLTEEEEIEALAQYMLDGEDEVRRLREEHHMAGIPLHQGHRRTQQLGGRNDPWFDGHGNYGSDDEDYDRLFMDVISGNQEQGESAHWSAQQQWSPRSALDTCQYPPNSDMDLS